MTKIVFNAKVLTPIHISGFSKKSIEEKKEKIEKIMKELINLGGDENIVKILEKEYIIKLEKLKKYASDQKDFIKLQGRYVFPASTLKGVFSSSIEHYVNWKLNNIERNRIFQNLIFRDVYLPGDFFERGKILIDNRKFLDGVEVLKPTSLFEIEMIVKEIQNLKIEEVVVYPTLKTLMIIDLIMNLKKESLLTQEILEYYHNYLNLFGRDFGKERLDEKYRFVLKNGLIVRVGKYCGKLSKITLESFIKTLQIASQNGKYIGKVYVKDDKKHLMGFLKLEVKSVE